MLDVMKAYGFVDWEFLLGIMQSMNFMCNSLVRSELVLLLLGSL